MIAYYGVLRHCELEALLIFIAAIEIKLNKRKMNSNPFPFSIPLLVHELILIQMP
jgi:hypothetical protein